MCNNKLQNQTRRRKLQLNVYKNTLKIYYLEAPVYRCSSK